ncbi:unnamed protein product [Musa acuminata var. zebrina]
MASPSSSSTAIAVEALTPNAASRGTLIPSLPDDLAAVILASIPYSHQSRLRATARSWRAFSPRAPFSPPPQSSPPLPPPPGPIPADPAITPPCLFDPATAAWALLPPLPCSPYLYGLSNFVPVALGHHLYVLGGSQFDARSYPLGHPIASAAVHRLDLTAPPTLSWDHLPDMLFPRGSFACAPLRPSDGGNNDEGTIIVAGGGSRHTMFPSVGSRMSSVECYCVRSGEWRIWTGLPRTGQGPWGFGQEEAGRRTNSGLWEVTVTTGRWQEWCQRMYYKDAMVLGLRSGKWRKWKPCGRKGAKETGAVVALDGEDGQTKEIFMLDTNDIFRYDFVLNRWIKESSLLKKIPGSSSCSFVAMNGELYVLTTAIQSPDISDHRRMPKKRWTLDIQIYNPEKKRWRFMTTNPPFNQTIDFKTVITCTIRL